MCTVEFCVRSQMQSDLTNIPDVTGLQIRAWVSVPWGTCAFCGSHEESLAVFLKTSPRESAVFVTLFLRRNNLAVYGQRMCSCLRFRENYVSGPAGNQGRNERESRSCCCSINYWLAKTNLTKTSILVEKRWSSYLAIRFSVSKCDGARVLKMYSLCMMVFENGCLNSDRFFC